MPETKIKLLCLGAGNMTSAIVPNFVKEIPELEVTAYTPSKVRAQALAEKINGEVIDNLENIDQYDWILLGFKPQQFSKIAAEIKSKLKGEQVVLSLLAGTKIDQIEKSLGVTQVVRLMPNTPAQVNLGASLMTFSSSLSQASKDIAKKMLDAIGIGVVCEEVKLETATPFSGSGPAYFYLLAEMMAKDLVDRGFSQMEAEQLCNQTFIGAAELLKQSNLSTNELRASVTSKGGVTHAAISSFQEQGLASMIRTAMDKAIERNTELSKS